MTIRLGSQTFSSPAEVASWFVRAATLGEGAPNPATAPAEVLVASWPTDDVASADGLVEGLLSVLEDGPDDVRAEALRGLQAANTPAYAAAAVRLLGAAPAWLDHPEPGTGRSLGHALTSSLLHGPAATDAAVARALWATRDRFDTRDLLLDGLCTVPVVGTAGIEILRTEHAAGQLDAARVARYGATIALYGRADVAIEIGAMLRALPTTDRSEFLRAASVWMGDRAGELAQALDL